MSETNKTMDRIAAAANLICSAAGAIVGCASISTGTKIKGIIDKISLYPGPHGYGETTHLGSVEFGADFYTEIYGATAFSGNALKAILDILSITIPALFILGGVLIICFSVRRFFTSPALSECLSAFKNAKGSQPLPATEAPIATAMPSAGDASNAEAISDPTIPVHDANALDGEESPTPDNEDEDSEIESEPQNMANEEMEASSSEVTATSPDSSC